MGPLQIGPPGNHVVDDIHSHWESYLQKYRVLANVPYSKFKATKGWDTVYTWDSLEEHEPALTNTLQKGNQAALDGSGCSHHHGDRRQLFPQQAAQACLYQEEVSLLWCQGGWEEELCAGGHLPLLQSVISECSFWLLPHSEALGTRFCMLRL